MDDHPGRLLTPAEVAAIIDERDHLRHELDKCRRRIESLTMEVQRLTDLFQVRSEQE